MTQFSGAGRGPIFWINRDLDKVEKRLAREDPMYRPNTFDAILQNILHEYGHVIYEWGEVRDPGLKKMIDRKWGDKEEWAEDFLRYVRNDAWANFPEREYKKVVQRYVKEVFV